MKKRYFRRYVMPFIILCLAIMLVFVFWVIRRKMIQNPFYQFKKSIMSEFTYVNKMEVGNYGPHCTVRVYVDEKYCEAETLEKVFIKVMTELSEDSNFQYLLERHNKFASGEMTFLNVYFYNGEEELCRYTSYKDFEVWELESDRSVQFCVSDYVQ